LDDYEKLARWLASVGTPCAIAVLAFGQDTVNSVAYWLVIGVWGVSLVAVVAFWVLRRRKGSA